MTDELPAELPRVDRSLVHLVARLVPVCDREEWSRVWQAELWHMRHPRRESGRTNLCGLADLAAGVVLDGLWLRVESWRRRWNGTAFLCLSTLFLLNVLSASAVLLLQWHYGLGIASLNADLRDCLAAAPLVLLVACVTNSKRHLDQRPKRRSKLILRFFFLTQMTHVLILAFLVSVSLSLPFHNTFPNLSDMFQMLCFICLSLVTLRWAIHDQERRCKQCLRLLTNPARIGRPSHNLLEWNGTGLMCRSGHGQLNVPEIETSWCDSSKWTDLDVA